MAFSPQAAGATASLEYHEQLLDAFPDLESLTVLIVSGASRDQVATALGIDLKEPVGADHWVDNEVSTGWAALEVPGGVLAIETSGYGDPTNAALRALSDNGGTAAVVRSNIDGHVRFGSARDGELLFDDNEFMYVEDPSPVAAELRPLLDLVWEDPDCDELDVDEIPSPFAVGLAMAELVTGIELTADDVDAVHGSQFFKTPTLVYARSLE